MEEVQRIHELYRPLPTQRTDDQLPTVSLLSAHRSSDFSYSFLDVNHLFQWCLARSPPCPGHTSCYGIAVFVDWLQVELEVQETLKQKARVPHAVIHTRRSLATLDDAERCVTRGNRAAAGRHRFSFSFIGHKAVNPFLSCAALIVLLRQRISRRPCHTHSKETLGPKWRFFQLIGLHTSTELRCCGVIRWWRRRARGAASTRWGGVARTNRCCARRPSHRRCLRTDRSRAAAPCPSRVAPSQNSSAPPRYVSFVR